MEMAKHNERPVIMPLSQPGAEVTPLNAYQWTDGRCIFADKDTRTDSAPVELPDGRQFRPRSCETAYIFPGGFGAWRRTAAVVWGSSAACKGCLGVLLSPNSTHR